MPRDRTRELERNRIERSKPRTERRQLPKPKHRQWFGRCPAFRPLDERDERRGRMAHHAD